MTGIEHAILATALLALFYYVGKAHGRRENLENVIENTLITLEDKGFIYCITNEDGEKELQPFPKKDLTEL